MTENTNITLSSSIDADDLQRNLRLKQLQLNSLLEVTEAINNNYPAQGLFKIYEFILSAQMRIGKLVVFHKDEDWKCVNHYGVEDKNAIIAIKPEEDLYGLKDVTYLKNNNDASDLLNIETLVALKEFDAILPVFHKEQALAYCIMSENDDDKSGERQNIPLPQRMTFIQTITNIIVVAIENKRLFNRQLEQESIKKELEVAQRVQNMLIPKVLPVNERVDMSSVYMPHHNISGDFYDYIPSQKDKDEFWFCMADISGKGIAAALLMANCQAVLRALIQESGVPHKLIKKFNRRVMDITNGEKYLTLFLGRYNLRTRNFCYINAGHNPPLLLHNNKIEKLDQGCTILGVFPELPSLSVGNLQIEPNSVIITYTDGLTELENEKGEFFELERLETFAATGVETAASMSDFNEELLQKIKTFKGNRAYNDDISILSCRFH